ncbi:CAP domain-containing protein [Cupriavidus oxalaticus]|uniref:CAP domain-containing protein n=1 Tax=Cupriavidus oxalaticus TaxID=96344 RepID=A0A4P7LUQ1_9BURK|nr:CAP domain-containing protein [Cupriavidus oxalaticus]QBY56347.1 CAP domain-containing protein [Cupriavidus oxalaticus]
MQKSKLALSVLATAMTLALAACGGGGGDDGGTKNPTTPPTTPPTPQAPTSVPPATSAPTPTYPNADLRLTTFNDLNDFRVKIGVGALKQDDKLDLAAANHLAYMKANSTISHLEVQGNAGFTGVTPYDQMVAAGGNKDQWIGQVAGGSLSCLANFKNSVYHLQSITGPQETVGIAMRDNFCVINYGLQTGANGNGYGIPLWGGQQMATNALAYSPVDNETVYGGFTPAGESPNPAPDLTNAGHPIMFRVPAPAASDVLTVSSFTLTGPGGVSIPVRVMVPTKAKAGSMAGAVEDANLFAGVVFMLPTQQLAAGTHTATFSGARNGSAISKSWSFTVQ